MEKKGTPGLHTDYDDPAPGRPVFLESLNYYRVASMALIDSS